ncbi:MAG: DUF2141 domain-containing protein [Chitinophagaceae bacterium]
MLKKISFHISIIVFMLLFASFKPVAEEGIKISITDLRSDNGYVLVSLFKEGVGYPDKPAKAFRKEKLPIKNKNTVILFTGLPAGNYAIAILHDENNDQEMNKNFWGIPKEGYGFSKNVMGTFGPPSFSKASFKHTAGLLTQVSIKAKYW